MLDVLRDPFVEKSQAYSYYAVPGNPIIGDIVGTNIDDSAVEIHVTDRVRTGSEADQSLSNNPAAIRIEFNEENPFLDFEETPHQQRVLVEGKYGTRIPAMSEFTL